MHINPFGRLLKADGLLGQETAWSLAFATMALGRQAAVRRALAHYGLVESAPNEDPSGIIRGWLKAAGAQPGDPWCASFASDCLGGYRSASAVTLGKHYPVVAFELALPADLLWFPTDEHGHGHVEMVLGTDRARRLAMTVGGNVANGVRLSLRPADRVNFSRTVNDSRGTCPGILFGHADVPLRVPSYAGTR